MTLSIWRYAHLALALSASLFVLVASISGIVLAFEPISNQLKPYAHNEIKTISLSETILCLKNKYDDIISLEADHNGFVSVSVITTEGEDARFYIDPKTGEKIGEIIEKSALFRFMTNLHRSLFLKSIGRFFVGLASFLLFLIALSGCVLVIKRQAGLKRFFSNIIKTNSSFYEYHHTFWGRLALFPLLIITFTGVYLSLQRFSIIPKQKISHQINTEKLISTPLRATSAFPIFRETTLDKVRYLEFPFSDDLEDYFTLKLKHSELLINQKTGDVLSEISYPFTHLISTYSLVLHTGQGSILWSVVLILATSSIFFFMYSGFFITLKRRETTIRNKYKKEDCEYIILVGSENGTSLQFANLLHQALLNIEKKSFLGELNQFTYYKNAKYLIVITATYGDGSAPANANKFLSLLEKYKPEASLNYAVVGFGSLAYANFCRFARDADAALNKAAYRRVMPVFTINNQSFEAFADWVNRWAKHENIQLTLPPPPAEKRKKEIPFRLLENTETDCNDTFLLTLTSTQNTTFRSGDLLSVRTKKDQRPRLYSIGKIDTHKLILSVKLHQKGIVSNYLNKLKKDDILTAGIKKNPAFHFPKKAKRLLLVATGTGIGPFLGMLQENTQKIPIHLFWGGPTEQSFQIYQTFIKYQIEKQHLSAIYLALSRAQKEKIYVQNLLEKHTKLVENIFTHKGAIMICGSVKMQKGVTEVLEKIAAAHTGNPLSFYQNRGQLLIDCY